MRTDRVDRPAGRPNIRRVLPSAAITHRDLCHPSSAPSPFTRAGWWFELKLDGFRALARRTRADVQLHSRAGRSMAEQFPEIVAALTRLPAGTALDGELVVPTAEGRSTSRNCAGAICWSDRA
jgi:bifunctional non-homologous end joining protein LigD